MGQFSWMYANRNNEKAMKDDVSHDSYLLVPKEFQKEYGKAIHESCYDGYGHIGGYDVYELVALWNRKYMPEETMCVRKPTAERFPDKEYYDMAISRWHKALDRLSDFKNEVSDEVMKEEYGEWYLKSIGIDIACYDVDNKKLKYPIKITDKILDYDDVPASESDPNQGW